MMKIGITGGIGSGKSTVCRLFAERGVAVYDSDSEAKRLMSGPLRPALEARFGAGIFRGGVLDRRALSDVVFRDARALADLNALVHPAVREDFEAWAAQQTGDYVILESAILFESGFDGVVDRVLAVMAPERLRIERTCRRDGVAEADVRRRMAVQLDDDALAAKADYTMVNLFEEDLRPAVMLLDRKFRQDANRK